MGIERKEEDIPVLAVEVTGAMIEAATVPLSGLTTFSIFLRGRDLPGRESSALGFEITQIRKPRRLFARAPTPLKRFLRSGNRNGIKSAVLPRSFSCSVA